MGSVWSFVRIILYFVGAGICTFMSTSDGLRLYIFRRKMEKTLPMTEEMDRKVFFSRPEIFVFVVNRNKKLFPMCTLFCRANNYVSCHGKGVKRRNEGTIIISVFIV